MEGEESIGFEKTVLVSTGASESLFLYEAAVKAGYYVGYRLSEGIGIPPLLHSFISFL